MNHPLQQCNSQPKGLGNLRKHVNRRVRPPVFDSANSTQAHARHLGKISLRNRQRFAPFFDFFAKILHFFTIKFEIYCVIQLEYIKFRGETQQDTQYNAQITVLHRFCHMLHYNRHCKHPRNTKSHPQYPKPHQATTWAMEGREIMKNSNISYIITSENHIQM